MNRFNPLQLIVSPPTLAHIIGAALLCLATLSAPRLSEAQTLYKWVDAQGAISYSDRPPPPDSRVKDLTDTLNTLGAGEAKNELGFATAQLVKKAPIVLYTGRGCPPCDQARAMLKATGYPYSERTINSAEDAKQIESKFKVQILPLLSVGEAFKAGFGAAEWQTLLNAAGYNATTVAPPNYLTGQVERMNGSAGAESAATASNTARNPVTNPAGSNTPNPTLGSANPDSDIRPFVSPRRTAPSAAPAEPLIRF